MDAVPRGRRMLASSGEGSQSLATGSLSEGYCNGPGRMACRLLRSAGSARRRPSASPLGQWVLTRLISRCLRVLRLQVLRAARALQFCNGLEGCSYRKQRVPALWSLGLHIMWVCWYGTI